MKKLVFTIFIISIFMIASCSIFQKFTGGDCLDQVDVMAITFENNKSKITNLTSIISNTGVLNKVDKSLDANMNMVAGWVGGLPRLDKVHYEATKYFVSSNQNILKAVGQKETIDQIEKEIADLKKIPSENEKQAKYLQILNDPKLQAEINKSTEKTQTVSAEKKQFLDKAYAHITYGLIYDAVTAGISSLTVTELKSQIDNIASSISNPIEAAKKTSCLQKSLSRVVDISTQAKDQITPAISIFNAICKIYASSGTTPPKVATSEGKPITSDLD